MNPPATIPPPAGPAKGRHTPTPWKTKELGGFGPVNIVPCSEGGLFVLPIGFTGSKRPQNENIANAAFIVESVNQHAALTARVAQLEGLREQATVLASIVLEYRDEQKGFADQIISPRHVKQTRLDIVDRCDAALVAARALLKP